MPLVPCPAIPAFPSDVGAFASSRRQAESFVRTIMLENSRSTSNAPSQRRCAGHASPWLEKCGWSSAACSACNACGASWSRRAKVAERSAGCWSPICSRKFLTRGFVGAEFWDSDLPETLWDTQFAQRALKHHHKGRSISAFVLSARTGVCLARRTPAWRRPRTSPRLARPQLALRTARGRHRRPLANLTGLRCLRGPPRKQKKCVDCRVALQKSVCASGWKLPHKR